MGNSMMCVSSSGSAICQQLNVLPRNLISSEGILGCGWLSEMPSSRACHHSCMCQRIPCSTWSTLRICSIMHACSSN